jgi:hypothetical protein
VIDDRRHLARLERRAAGRFRAARTRDVGIQPKTQPSSMISSILQVTISS